jgi:hypothetical protein
VVAPSVTRVLFEQFLTQPFRFVRLALCSQPFRNFEFSMGQNSQQLVVGYSKSPPNKGLLVYMADDREIQPSSQPTQK